MSGGSGLMRTMRWVLAFGAVLALAGGCVAVADTVSPPRAPEGASGVELKASPVDLALNRSDMPAGFELAAEKSSGPEYVALYLRPSALDDAASGGNRLLSVMTSVGVYTTTVDAEQIYAGATARPDEKSLEDAAKLSEAAKDVVTETFSGAAVGTDASEAFRVSYKLMDQSVYEYGHRFRIGNVLAHVVVAAVGNPEEPQNLLMDARDIVQRQIDHIVDAAKK